MVKRSKCLEDSLDSDSDEDESDEHEFARVLITQEDDRRKTLGKREKKSIDKDETLV